MAVALIVFIRAGYAELVSSRVIGTQSPNLARSLLLGGMIYVFPSTILFGRLGLYPFVIPVIRWFNDVLIGLRVQPALKIVLKLSWLALILDFLRLMLFIAFERRIASPESIARAYLRNRQSITH